MLVRLLLTLREAWRGQPFTFVLQKQFLQRYFQHREYPCGIFFYKTFCESSFSSSSCSCSSYSLFFLLLFFLFFCFLFRFSFFLSFFVFVLPWVLVLWFQKKCLQNFFRHRELLDRNCSTFFINFVAWKPVGLLSTLRKAWWAHLPKNFFFLLFLSHLLHLHQILLHIYFIVKNYVVFIVIVVFFVLTVLKTNN